MARRYKSLAPGLKAVGQSTAVSQVALAAARDLAAEANRADPSGRYEAASKTVIVGWMNERRAGAVVREGAVSWRGRRERTLARVAGLMKARGS
jgi:hypothetical protein